MKKQKQSEKNELQKLINKSNKEFLENATQ